MTAPVICAWEPPEEWRTIPPFPAYEVSSHGRIRRAAPIFGGHGSVRAPGHILKARPLPVGHLQVTLCMGNKPRTVLVHRMVAMAFLPPPPPDCDCVCHRDDEPSHNSPENLFWGTRKDNSDDKVSKGRQAKGERVSSAKLTPVHVLEIRTRAASGEHQRDIAKAFGISQSNVSMIASRVTWDAVP